MAEEYEKSRKHEMEIMKLIISQPHLPFQEPSSSLPFHYHSPSSSGNSSPFQEIFFSSRSRHCRKKRKPRESSFFLQCVTNTTLSDV